MFRSSATNNSHLNPHQSCETGLVQEFPDELTELQSRWGADGELVPRWHPGLFHSRACALATEPPSLFSSFYACSHLPDLPACASLSPACAVCTEASFSPMSTWVSLFLLVTMPRGTLFLNQLCCIGDFATSSEGWKMFSFRFLQPKQWGNPGFDPWVRKIPWRRDWQPTPVFLPGEFHGQRSLAGHSP